jgi:hypothetical protein
MVELTPLIVLGVPTAIGAIAGAARALAKEARAERERLSVAPAQALQGAGKKIDEVLKGAGSDYAVNVGWGTFIGAACGLAVGVVLNCALWFADSVAGAKESSDTLQRMGRRSRTSQVQEDEGRERVQRPAYAPAKLAFVDNQNYGQWMALERERMAKVQVRPLGKPMLTAGSRRAG